MLSKLADGVENQAVAGLVKVALSDDSSDLRPSAVGQQQAAQYGLLRLDAVGSDPPDRGYFPIPLGRGRFLGHGRYLGSKPEFEVSGDRWEPVSYNPLLATNSLVLGCQTLAKALLMPRIRQTESPPEMTSGRAFNIFRSLFAYFSSSLATGYGVRPESFANHPR